MLVPYFLRSLSMLSGIVASVWAIDAQIMPEIPSDGMVHMNIEGQYIHGERKVRRNERGGVTYDEGSAQRSRYMQHKLDVCNVT